MIQEKEEEEFSSHPQQQVAVVGWVLCRLGREHKGHCVARAAEGKHLGADLNEEGLCFHRWQLHPGWLCIINSSPTERSNTISINSNGYALRTRVLKWMGPGDEDGGEMEGDGGVDNIEKPFLWGERDRITKSAACKLSGL